MGNRPKHYPQLSCDYQICKKEEKNPQQPTDSKSYGEREKAAYDQINDHQTKAATNSIAFLLAVSKKRQPHPTHIRICVGQCQHGTPRNLASPCNIDSGSAQHSNCHQQRSSCNTGYSNGMLLVETFNTISLLAKDDRVTIPFQHQKRQKQNEVQNLNTRNQNTNHIKNWFNFNQMLKC